MANQNKGSTSKEVPKTQVPHNLPPPSPPMTVEGLLPCLDLKKKRKALEGKEGEIIPPKEAKQPKNVKDKRAPSAESKEETGVDAC